MSEAEMDNQITENVEKNSLCMTTLTNGLKVANFSSPHSFEFTDGTILPAVGKEKSLKLSMKAIETIHVLPTYHGTDAFKIVAHISLTFRITEDVLKEILYWLKQFDNGYVDIVIVPLPVIQVIRDGMGWNDSHFLVSPFRTIRMSDRISKKCCTDKFCI